MPCPAHSWHNNSLPWESEIKMQGRTQRHHMPSSHTIYTQNNKFSAHWCYHGTTPELVNNLQFEGLYTNIKPSSSRATEDHLPTSPAMTAGSQTTSTSTMNTLILLVPSFPQIQTDKANKNIPPLLSASHNVNIAPKSINHPHPLGPNLYLASSTNLGPLSSSMCQIYLTWSH